MLWVVTIFVNYFGQLKQKFPTTWRGYISQRRIILHSWIKNEQEKEQDQFSRLSGPHSQEASQKGINIGFAMLEKNMLFVTKWGISLIVKADQN